MVQDWVHMNSLMQAVFKLIVGFYFIILWFFSPHSSNLTSAFYMPYDRQPLSLPVPEICSMWSTLLHLLFWLSLQINECFKTEGPASQQTFMSHKQDILFILLYHHPDTGYLSFFFLLQQLLWLSYLISQHYGSQLTYIVEHKLFSYTR